MCFLPLKSSHYPSRPVPVPELFGKYPTRPVPKSKTPTRRTLFFIQFEKRVIWDICHTANRVQKCKIEVLEKRRLVYPTLGMTKNTFDIKGQYKVPLGFLKKRSGHCI